MTTALSDLEDVADAFDSAASNVLGALRTALANVLASVGGVRKPADLQKLFKLDWTLSWQLFQVAGAGGDASAIGMGANVPSRTSLKKFLESARLRGVDAVKVEKVWASFEMFERLIEVHAGDRTSFNSMVSAADGINDEWLATDAQHRRNAYRAMSHVVGMQAMTKHICGVCTASPDGQHWDLGVVVGYVGLRMLRSFSKSLVFRMRMLEPSVRQQLRRDGLGPDPDVIGGYLFPDFSTLPLPKIRTRELDAGWLVAELENPLVGNLGACTLRFGTAYRGHPVPGQRNNDPTFDCDVVVDKPVEVVVMDVLVQPGLMRGAVPVAGVVLGNNHGDAPSLPGDFVELLGDHRAELLGRGPDALATPDVPDYPELMRAAAARLGCDVENYEVYRVRVEFPVYQSTVRMSWTLPPVSG